MTNRSSFDVPDLSDPEETRPSTETRYSCVDCRVFSPTIESSFTLISARYGWRLHRYRDGDSGRILLDWRCPRCWRQFREERRRRALESFPPLVPRSSGVR